MPEDTVQLQKGLITPVTLFIDISAERLSKRMGAKVFYAQIVLSLPQFSLPIDVLNADRHSFRTFTGKDVAAELWTPFKFIHLRDMLHCLLTNWNTLCLSSLHLSHDYTSPVQHVTPPQLPNVTRT